MKTKYVAVDPNTACRLTRAEIIALAPEMYESNATKESEMIKERPILFSGAMIRAILAGTKTMTRRVVKPQPEMIALAGEPVPAFGRKLCAPGFEAVGVSVINKGGNDGLVKCPYGMTGERLWVRETFAVSKGGGRWAKGTTLFRADHGYTHGGTEMDLMRWKPSIFMPRLASRITLEITSVRVERIQDITAKDILAEGAVARAHADQFGRNPVSAFDGKCYMDLQSLWAIGWNSINQKRGFGWVVNPYVWVVSFKRV